MAGGSAVPPQRTKGRTAWLSRPAWTGIGSLVGILGLAVALGAWWLPQSAESSAGSTTPQSAGSTAAQPADSSAVQGADAVVPPSETDSTAPAVTEAAPRGQTYLYELPATSAGGPGPQRRPIDVRLAGNRYAHSTGMWTQCGGAAAPQVTFYTGQKYQHLAGTLGVDSSAPGGCPAGKQLVHLRDGVVF